MRNLGILVQICKVSLSKWPSFIVLHDPISVSDGIRPRGYDDLVIISHLNLTGLEIIANPLCSVGALLVLRHDLFDLLLQLLNLLLRFVELHFVVSRIDLFELPLIVRIFDHGLTSASFDDNDDVDDDCEE